MPHGFPSIGRQSYVRIKWRRDTHTSWVELKASPKLKCDDALVCYLLASSETASSSSQDSQVEESIAGRRTKVALSVHGTSNMPYTVVRVRKLLTHYVYIQKYLNGFVNST